MEKKVEPPPGNAERPADKSRGAAGGGLTQAEVEHVARLARLGLVGEDREMFSRQLNEILLYMEKLGELETDGVEPLAHVLPLENVLRKDESRPGIGQEKALANAPEKKDGLFKVPPVIE